MKDGRRAVGIGAALCAALLLLALTPALSAGTGATTRVQAPRVNRSAGAGATARAWGTCSQGVLKAEKTWHLAEGCTAPGFETWVLVQNPGDTPVDVTMDLQTDAGPVPGPSGTVPPQSRRTYDLSRYVVSYNVSTKVIATGPVVCERAMYGNGREWGTCSQGVLNPGETWHLAEGCTAPGFETWVLVQNPGETAVDVTMDLQTDAGPVPGPSGTVPPQSRRTYDLSRYVVSYNVSTKVIATGPVVCERAMYGNGREWGTCSQGVLNPGETWHLAEGCTLPGFETWVLVQNPEDTASTVCITLFTESGEVRGPMDTIPARSRRSYDLSLCAPGASLAAVVESSDPVVVERSMYGGDRLWGTCASPSTASAGKWHLAEGCTAPGFETWLEVMNPPGEEESEVSIELLTADGVCLVPSRTVQPGRRVTFDLGGYVTSHEVSAVVKATGLVFCERSMYGDGTNRRPVAPVDGPPLYPFTRDESIACGHWPPGSTDYPYFGAPRAGTRLHAGVDIYPPAGPGATVRSMKAGTVLKTGLFYTRYTGEQTFAVLVDHGEFVANYAELRPLDPRVRPGAALARGQVIGLVSGTAQLHLEMYAPGTTGWMPWYGPQPASLLDPTGLLLTLY